MLLPLVILFCMTGMYTVNNSVFDIWMMLLFGGRGFLMRKWAYEVHPSYWRWSLAPNLEVAFRQSLMISHGDFGTFVNRPISLAFLLGAVIFLLAPLCRILLRKFRKGR